MAAPKNNTHAQKGDDPRTSHLNMRCLQSDKALWTKAAQATGQNLTTWVESTLNRAAQATTNRKR